MSRKGCGDCAGTGVRTISVLCQESGFHTTKVSGPVVRNIPAQIASTFLFDSLRGFMRVTGMRGFFLPVLLAASLAFGAREK